MSTSAAQTGPLHAKIPKIEINLMHQIYEFGANFLILPPSLPHDEAEVSYLACLLRFACILAWLLACLVAS